MSNDNKTLADVQPGGRVRLGDGLVLAKLVGAAGLMLAEIDTCGHEVDPAYRRTLYEAWEEGKAALSAQPSPGGQDALDCIGRIEEAIEFRVPHDIYAAVHGELAELKAALAARQPVGEPVAWVHEEDPSRVISASQKATALRDQGASGSSVRPYSVPAYLHAPAAQAVDLAQEPMFYIQDTRQFVGNCPVWWAPNGGGYVTRLDEAGRYTEQEAVKKNRTRDTDIPWPCAEIDAIARPTVDFQHMRPRAERLAELALIDSQAVGNG